MRRVDRAIFAIFLLALVADVARSYALTPVSPEISGSLILHAASQFQGGSKADDLPSNRGRGYGTQAGRRAYKTPILAAWSRSLGSPMAAWSQVAVLPPDGVLRPEASGYYADTPQYLPASSLERIEHAGNPAP